MLIASASCIHGINVWDNRPIYLKYLNFDEKLEINSPDVNSWERDLNFRHARLGLMNDEVARDQPDLVALLGVQVKSGSVAESDLAVLVTGPLGDYNLVVSELSRPSDEARKIFAATAVALPLMVDEARTLNTKAKWNLGEDGYASASLIKNNESPFVLLTVQMPSRSDQLARSYGLLENIIFEVTEQFGVCLSRIVISGYLPQDLIVKSDQAFLSKIRFVDSASGFCERTQNCATFHSDNEMGYSVYGNALGTRDERVLLHSTAVILRASPAFEKGSGAVAKIFPEYGFEVVHPSTRYGWQSSFSLKKCNE